MCQHNHFRGSRVAQSRWPPYRQRHVEAAREGELQAARTSCSFRKCVFLFVWEMIVLTQRLNNAWHLNKKICECWSKGKCNYDNKANTNKGRCPASHCFTLWALNLFKLWSDDLEPLSIIFIITVFWFLYSYLNTDSHFKRHLQTKSSIYFSFLYIGVQVLKLLTLTETLRRSQ